MSVEFSLQCFSVVIRPLRFTTPPVECVAVKFCTVVNYLLIITNHRRFKHGVVVSETVFFCNDKTIMAYSSCIAVKFSTIVNYLLMFTNHHRFKRGVMVSEGVFFCNDKTIMA